MFIVVISENLIGIMISVSVHKVLKHSNQNKIRNSLLKWKIITHFTIQEWNMTKLHKQNFVLLAQNFSTPLNKKCLISHFKSKCNILNE